MKIEAIFFDFDGTLHPFESDKIPDSALEALHLLAQKHIKLFIATGRGMGLLPELNFVDFSGYITCNGSVVLDELKNILYERFFEKQDIENLIQYMKDNPFTIAIQDGNRMKVNRLSEHFNEVANHLQIPEIIHVENEDLLKEKIQQMNFFVNEEQEFYLMNHVMKSAQSTRWTHLFADVNPLGVSKWEGVDYFLDKNNLNQENCMAFGDGGNDLTMIKNAGIGVAMGNANENLKQAADFVTKDADKDGIYHALKHYGII